MTIRIHDLEPVAHGVWRLRIGEPEAITPVALRETPPAPGLADLPAGSPPFAAAQVRAWSGARGIAVELPLAGSEEIFGFGLQLKSVAQQGKRKVMRVNADPVADTGDSHAPVPFYCSTAGYAVLADTARQAVFHVGTNPRLADGEPEGGRSVPADEVADLYRSRTRARSTVIIDVPAARGVDLYLFAGPGLSEAVRRHVLWSGGGAMPPLWGLGPWYRACAKHDAPAAQRLADEIRADRIPCDVFGLEPGWQTRAYPSTFVWDAGRFPDPAAAVGALRAQGYRVNLWEHCYTHPASPLWSDMRPHAGEHVGMHGLVPDFTVPAARRAFADYHRRTFASQGIAGFKLDECDSSDFTGGWSFPECTRFPGGADGEQMHALLGVLYQRTMLDPYRAEDRRTYGQVRAAHAMAAPLPYVLYSDLYEHRDFIRGMVTAPFSGLLWCPEVRSCTSTADLVRRVQTTAVSVHALINAWTIPHAPWWQVDRHKNIAGEEMAERALATRLVRQAFELRQSLLPILYTAFARYHREGLPPVRSLAMDFPEDVQTHAIDDQVLLGDALLVAPMTAEQAWRSVYLPAGEWYDFWTGARVAGGQRHQVAHGLDTFPIFVRGGRLVPLARPVPCVGPGTRLEVTVRVYGDAPATGRLYEDDGETFAFERGEWAAWDLAWSADGGGRAERHGRWSGSRIDISGWQRMG